ncbi:hypothetical protein PP178_02940 [Zeaxanthinibacter sp. PT1]|uniref:hypothetical protein n=1 Tax=Zeaxanthinibacter TaxID=561554 RepID=UPI002349672B|nr:hypothetical protein [Zeaxanthinibacter sp. PT1]MDC6350493.1 hypothetical protein [Zeaxanthinibacter sp. PT1]
MGKINLVFILTTVIAILSTVESFSQTAYCVLKARGEPVINQNSPVFKGALVSPGDTLELKEEDYVLLVGPEGNIYEIQKSEVYVYSDLRQYRLETPEESFMRKYFSYLWKQFTEQDKVKDHIGVVYREGMTPLLLSPANKVNMFVPEIEFSWVIPEKTTMNYFFLENLQSGQLFKFGITGNSLLLYVDGIFLQKGSSFQWGVASDPFPNLKKLKYHSFKLLNAQEFEELKSQLYALSEYLKALGYSDEEISETLCTDFKYCFQGNLK